MKLFDIEGKLVQVDIKQSSYPIKAVSKSILQGKVAEFLQDKYPFYTILEEFKIPGARLFLDLYIPKLSQAYEVQSIIHQKSGYFHGDKLLCNYAKQIKRDNKKIEWCLMNKIDLIEIYSEKDLEKL